MMSIAQELVRSRASKTSAGSSCIIGTDEHRPKRNRWDTSRSVAVVFGKNPSLPKGFTTTTTTTTPLDAAAAVPPSVVPGVAATASNQSTLPQFFGPSTAASNANDDTEAEES